ncbi:MAG: LamG-like jellyroll fold domain-containing protein [Myxococcota bacterium]
MMQWLCALAMLGLVFGCGAAETSAPDAPSMVRALPGNQFVRLAWEDNSSNESGFAIYREVLGIGGFDPVANVGPDVTEWDDLKVETSTRYRYAVAATGTSADSKLVEMTGDPVSPLAGSPIDCSVAPKTAEDQDSDGVSDANERAGWMVTITDGLGSTTQRMVSSNPLIGDSDNDGLCDREERQSATDPGQPDTDGDGLDDLAELRTWGSKPDDVDSDNDSRGNAALFDGNELLVHLTSPTIADTDGDNIDDYVELIERGEPFDPLVANTPIVELTFEGATDLTLNVAFADSTIEAESQDVSLEREKASSQSKTRSTTHEAWAEVGVSMTNSAQASFPPGGSVSSSVTVSASAGYGYTGSQSVTRTSSQASREAYQWGVNTSRQADREIADGTLALGLRARNLGDVSFRLFDLSVTALLRDPIDPTQFSVVGELHFDDTTFGADGTVLSPSSATGPLRASSSVPANRALELMANPEGLFFEVASFELSNSEGQNFGFLSETTNAQTGLVTIDFGNGVVIEQRVATNVLRDNARIVGIRMADVLNRALGLSYRTAVQDDDKETQVLVAVTPPGGDEVAFDETASRFWAVIGSSGTTIDDVSFDEILLQAGESITLFYVKDRDGDGLFAHEEYLFGTSEESPDGDGDGLTDLEEAKVGWQVAVMDPPVYPAPTWSDPTEADSDADGLSDFEERNAQTDPFNPDSDGDGFCDGPGTGRDFDCPALPDTDPIDPTDFPATAVAAFAFSGDAVDSLSHAILTPIVAACPVSVLLGADRDNLADSALDIEVNQVCSGDPSDHAGMTSDRSYDFDDGFTVMFWLNLDVSYTDEPWYVIGVEDVFSLRMLIDNSSSPDSVQVGYFESGVEVVRDPAIHAAGTWDHYALTVASTTVRLYRNGVEVASGPRSSPELNASLLLFNASDGDTPDQAFGVNGHGRFDDLFIYDEALSANAVLQAYHAQN